MSSTVLAESNFLIPNGTFLAELVVFAVILAFVHWLVVPPLQRAMRRRGELIREQFEEARQARERAEAAEQQYTAAMNEARAQGARIREEARAQGQQVLDELRAGAQREAEALNQRGRQQLLADREAMLGGLRAEMATLAVELASRIVGESLAEEARASGTVERFLAERAGQPVAAGEQAG